MMIEGWLIVWNTKCLGLPIVNKAKNCIGNQVCSQLEQVDDDINILLLSVNPSNIWGIKVRNDCGYPSIVPYKGMYCSIGKCVTTGIVNDWNG